MTYLIFIIIQLNLWSRDTSIHNLNFPDVIFISKIIKKKFHENFSFFESRKYTRGKNQFDVYSWIVISCWDGFLWILPESADFYHFWWFFNEFSAFCTWAILWILWIFAFWLGKKFSHKLRKILSRNQIIMP